MPCPCAPCSWNLVAPSWCGLCLKYVKLLPVCPPPPPLFDPPSPPPQSDCGHRAVSPSLPPPYIHPTLTLPLSTQAYQPPPPPSCLSPTSPLSTRIPPLISRTCYTPTHPPIPFYPSLLQLGAGCWGSGWGSLPDKLRFRRAETGGEGNLRQTFV